MEGGVRGAVVLACAFLIQFLVFGTSACVGIYIVELMDYFQKDYVGVSLFSAVYYALFFITGPAVSSLITFTSYRKVTLLGAFLTVTGTFCSALYPNLVYIYVFFGAVSGTGSCMVYIPSHTLSGLYYHKHRALSTGIAVTGSGLGGFVMPFVVEKLIEIYTWRGSLIVLAGLHLHLFVLAMFMVPPDNPPDHDEASNPNPEEPTKGDNYTYGNRAFQPDWDISMTIEQPGDVSTIAGVPETSWMPGHGYTARPEDSGFTMVELSASQLEPPEQSVSQKEDLIPESSNSFASVVKRHALLFTYYKFTLYFLCVLTFNLTQTVFYTYGPELVVEKGYDLEDATFFFSFVGLGLFFGCAFISVVVNFSGNAVAWTMIASALLAVGFLVLPDIWGTEAHVLLHLGIGLTEGVLHGVGVVIAVDSLGVANMGLGLAYILMAGGVGSFLGPPVFGALREAVSTYRTVFFVNGMLTFVSVVLMVPVLLSNFWTRRQRKSREPTDLSL